jgi:hypothetical protein
MVFNRKSNIYSSAIFLVIFSFMLVKQIVEGLKTNQFDSIKIVISMIGLLFFIMQVLLFAKRTK